MGVASSAGKIQWPVVAGKKFTPSVAVLTGHPKKKTCAAYLDN